MNRQEAATAAARLEGEIQKLEEQISILRQRVRIINSIPADFVQGPLAEKLWEAAARAAGENE